MSNRRECGASMNIYATLYDNRNEKAYDISQVISNVEITTHIKDEPGKATFDITKCDGIEFWEGATVSIQLDGYKMFRGFVFSKKKHKKYTIPSTNYCAKRPMCAKTSFILDKIRFGRYHKYGRIWRY